MDIPEEQLQILRHSLGIDNLRWYDLHKIDMETYRNHFATCKGTTDYPIVMCLVAVGLMAGPFDTCNYEFFTVTNEGIAAAQWSARENAIKTKPSRSKARYQAYLHSESDETFIAWLKNPYWDDMRKRYMVQ